MAKTKQSAITRIFDLLANEGQKIVAKELAKVSYTYRSLNLRDSYGWGVYVDGKLARKGYTASSPGIKKNGMVRKLPVMKQWLNTWNPNISHIRELIW